RAERARSLLPCHDLLQVLRRHAQLPAPPERADGRPRRAGLALRPADVALSAVRDEDEQAAEEGVRVAGVVLLEGPHVAVRRDGAEDGDGIGTSGAPHPLFATLRAPPPRSRGAGQARSARVRGARFTFASFVAIPPP